MENRSIDWLGNISWIVSTSSLLRNSGESNLIVAYDMDSASNRVVLQTFHLDALVDNTLSCKWSVSVDQEWYDLVSIGYSTLSVSDMVLSSDSSHYNWVNAFQVRWVCKNFNCEVFSIWVWFRITCSQVILDISWMSFIFLSFFFNSWSCSLEFSKDCLQRFSQHVGKHTKSSSMWHSNWSFVCSMSLDLVHGGFHSWNHRFTSFETKPLHGIKLGANKVSKLICP